MSSSGSVGQQREQCPHSKDASSLLGRTLTEPEILAHPDAFYSAMRSDDPVHYDPKLDMYLVSRYDDLQKVLRDPITFSVKKGYEEQYAKGVAEEFKATLIREGGGYFPDIIMTDPPEHTRVRRIMEQAFTAHRVKELEPRITTLVVDLLEKLADRGEADAVKDFAVPLTVAVICEQLGFDQFDAQKIQRWAIAATSTISRMQSRDEMLAYAKEMCELQLYLIDRIRERQAKRTNDLLSDLVYAKTSEEEDSGFTFEELVSLARPVIVGGHETTSTALTNLFFVLATQPEALKILEQSVDDERLLTRFVEEFLRIEPPVRGLSRMTTREVELGGKTLPAGAHLLLLYASGNSDESEFACPRTYDIERVNLGRHITFGAGVHRCIGAALARMEVKVAAREIVKRLDKIKLTIPVEDLTYIPTVATRTISKLPLTFTRRV